MAFALFGSAVILASLAYVLHTLRLQSDAVIDDSAFHWAGIVNEELPDVYALARGKPLDADLRYQIERISSTGAIRAIRIYNVAGRMVAAAGQPNVISPDPSSLHGAPQGEYPGLGRHSSIIARNATTVTVQSPLVEAGIVLGRMEVDVDASFNREILFVTALKASIALLIAIGAAAFGGFILLLRQRRIAANELSTYSQHDQLTGLPNRRRFERDVDLKLSPGQATEKLGCLVVCEISGLDALVQTYGPQAADNIAILSANRFSELKSPGSCIGNLGPGRFGIFVPSIADAMDALQLAKDVTLKLSAPATWQNESVPLATFAGISLSPTDVSDAAGLLRCAELALRQAQEQGSPVYSFYNNIIATDARRRIAVQRAVNDALNQNAFRLDFQPIYSTATGHLSGFEALIRLHDQELGPVSPAEFIPIAEQAGLINRIGSWCLLEACRVAAQWPPHLTVSVNLSPSQFYAGSVINDVRDALIANQIASYRLELEITEGTLLKGSELVLQQLGVLRDMGCSVALDDFGTGYSSLSYLWRFPFSKIKIDRSFVNALDENPNARAILRTIIKLGHGMGFVVTAEGIETQSQFSVLKELRCDLAQGYLLGRPARQTDLAAIILRNFGEGLRRRAAAAQAAPEDQRTTVAG